MAVVVVVVVVMVVVAVAAVVVVVAVIPDALHVFPAIWNSESCGISPLLKPAQLLVFVGQAGTLAIHVRPNRRDIPADSQCAQEPTHGGLEPMLGLPNRHILLRRRIEQGQPHQTTTAWATVIAVLAMDQDVAGAEHDMVAQLEEELLPLPGCNFILADSRSFPMCAFVGWVEESMHPCWLTADPP